VITFFQLQTFCEVIERGTFSAAAEKLYISQPSVSQHIANLEKHFGVKLFDRRKRKVRLTPEGRVLYSTAKEVLEQLDRAKKRIDDLRSLEAGTLNIGCSHYVDSLLLWQVLPEFVSQHPKVSVSTFIGTIEELKSALLSSDIELIFAERTPDFVPSSQFSSKVVASEKLVFVATSDLAGKKTSFFTPKDLERYPLIGWHPSSCLFSYLNDFQMQNQLRLRRKITVSSIEAARELALKGHGIALLNLRSVEDDIAMGRLIKLEVKTPQPLKLDILALFHQTQGLTYAGWEMIKFLERKLLFNEGSQ